MARRPKRKGEDVRTKGLKEQRKAVRDLAGRMRDAIERGDKEGLKDILREHSKAVEFLYRVLTGEEP